MKESTLYNMLVDIASTIKVSDDRCKEQLAFPTIKRERERERERENPKNNYFRTIKRERQRKERESEGKNGSILVECNLTLNSPSINKVRTIG